MNKFRIAFFGSYPFSVHYLRGLAITKEIEVTLIVTREDIAEDITPVAQWARQTGRAKILSQPEKIKSITFREEFNKATPDLVVCAAYSKRIPDELLVNVKYRGINIHPSFLPKWRGPDPIRRSLVAGDEHIGCSIHKLTKEFDAGDIYWQDKVTIDEDDNVDTLLNKLMTLSLPALINVIISIRNENITYFSQSNQFTYASSFTDEERTLTKHLTIKEADRLIRAMSPNKGAILHIENHTYLVFQNNTKGEHILKLQLKDGVYIANNYKQIKSI